MNDPCIAGFGEIMLRLSPPGVLRLPQVLNYFVHRVTNAFSEGMNSRIQGLIKQANGYRNRERLKRDLYFHLGNLDMLPIMQ